MDTISMLKKTLLLELKLERCDNLVKKYTRSYLDKQNERKRNPSCENTKEMNNYKHTKYSESNVCWGCLKRGNMRDMHSQHQYAGTVEVYADMVEFCFSIVVAKHKRSYICFDCIHKLRESMTFKNQIIQSQNTFEKFTGNLTNVNSFECLTKLLGTENNYGFQPSYTTNFSTPQTHTIIRNQMIPQNTRKPTTKEPCVVLQGSQVFFNSQMVYLDANKQCQSVEEKSDENRSLGSDSFPMNTLTYENNDNVEKVEVTPYVSNMNHMLDENSLEEDIMQPNYSMDNYNINYQSQYSPHNEFKNNHIRTSNNEPESNVLDLIAFDGTCRCPFCQEEFYSIQERRDHMNSKHPSPPEKYMCEECGRFMSSRTHLKNHVKNIHLQVRRFACPLCHRAFYRRDSYKRHMQRLHHVNFEEIQHPLLDREETKIVQIYSCSVCGLTLDTDNIKDHDCQGIPEPEDHSDLAILPDL